MVIAKTYPPILGKSIISLFFFQHSGFIVANIYVTTMHWSNVCQFYHS